MLKRLLEKRLVAKDTDLMFMELQLKPLKLQLPRAVVISAQISKVNEVGGEVIDFERSEEHHHHSLSHGHLPSLQVNDAIARELLVHRRDDALDVWYCC